MYNFVEWNQKYYKNITKNITKYQTFYYAIIEKLYRFGALYMQ